MGGLQVTRRSGYRRESEPPEIKFFPCDTEVFDDVGNDPAGHISRMPRKSDEAVRMEWI
jgi:hypothetical protein